MEEDSPLFRSVPGCQRRVFAERLPEVAVPRARRTGRLADIQRHIGLALGGEAGSCLARRLTMPIGATTLLGMLRRGAPETPAQAPRVLGVDDLGVAPWQALRHHSRRP
jgi:hypothetical protein